MADISGFLSGSWLYRSFNPTYVTGNQTPQEEWGLIRADRAVLNLDSYLPPGGGSRQQPPYLRGALEWEGGGLNLNGTVRLYSAFESPDFVGTGRPDTDTAGWEYRYHGHRTGPWLPSRGGVQIPINQHPTLVGSVIRVNPHTPKPGGGWESPAGEVFSFIAVKQPNQLDGVSGLWNYRSYINKEEYIYRDPPRTRNELILQEAILKLEATLQGAITILQGTIEWQESLGSANLRLDLNGRVFQQGGAEPPNFTLEGTGGPGTDTAGWEYGYRGQLTRLWSKEDSSSGVVVQRAALVGDVIRWKSHGGSPAGYVYPFIAVKQ